MSQGVWRGAEAGRGKEGFFAVFAGTNPADALISELAEGAFLKVKCFPLPPRATTGH